MTDQEWYDALPGEPISQKALDSLGEYSISLPTLAIPGKIWKRNFRWGQPGMKPQWIICEYVDHPTKLGLLQVEYRRPVIKPVIKT